MRPITRFAVVLLGTAFLPWQAHADEITTFALSGGQQAGAGPFSGTVRIDTTTGTILGASLTLNLDGTTFVNHEVVPQYAFSGTGPVPTEGAYLHDADYNLGFYLNLPVDLDPVSDLPTLVGYAGGPLCDSTTLCYTYDNVSYFDGYNLNATGEEQYSQSRVLYGGLHPVSGSSPTPEPSGIALFGTGMLSLAGALGRRARRRPSEARSPAC